MSASVPEVGSTEPPLAYLPKWDPSQSPESVRQWTCGESGKTLGEIECGGEDGSLDPVNAACRLYQVVFDVAVRDFGGSVNKGKH